MHRVVLAALLVQLACAQVRLTPPAPPAPTKLPTTIDDKCEVKLADIAIVVDGSGSVGSTEWKQSLDFAANVVNGYDIGRDKVRIALISFSSTSKLVFDFNKYSTKAQVIAAIRNAPKEDSNTNTHLALDMARTQVFQTSRGMRPNVPHILMVVTDGQSTVKDAMIASAKAVHNSKITVIAVGVKGAVLSELQAMASANNLVFNYGDFNKLIALQDTFSKAFCKVAVKLATSTMAPPAPTTTPCVVKSADIAFVVDASGSVSTDDWKKSLNFAQAVVQGFDVGLNEVRVAMMTFSSTADMVFHFNKYTNKNDVRTAIASAPKKSGGTATHLALNKARDSIFQTANGMRRGVPNILFVITDGKSGSATATLASAASLHARGITVFAIGVKNANAVELKGIASDPSLVYNYQSFDKLTQLQSIFSQKACKVAASLAPVGPTKPTPIAGCSLNAADIVFVVDTSSSVGDANFNLTKQFLYSMMERLDFSKTRVGMIQFNDKVADVFQLNQNNDLASAQRSVSGMKYDKGSATRISAALKHMREVSFTPANGDRPNAPNIGILLTDGQGKDAYRTQYEGNATKAAGIQLFAVGIGNDINRNELQKLVSSQTFLYFLDDFTKLINIRDVLAGNLCQGFTLPPTTTPAPCLCKDKDDYCGDYGSHICFESQYRAFAIDKCPLYCDLCPKGCLKAPRLPKPCRNNKPDCDKLLNVCTDQRYKQYALDNCAKFCKICDQLNTQPIVQTTTPSTIPPITTPKRVVVSTRPAPTSPTPFVPCDNNCYDKSRDCKDYDKKDCASSAYEAFFRVNCEAYCGFCTEKAACLTTPGVCRDQQDCSGYSDASCLQYPDWAKNTCPMRCGLCPGASTIGPPKCEDKVDCPAYGKDVCTDFPNFAKEKCPVFCGHCVGTGTTTPFVCANKRDCTVYQKDFCKNPDYRKFMFAECRLYCNLCGEDA